MAMAVFRPHSRPTRAIALAGLCAAAVALAGCTAASGPRQPSMSASPPASTPAVSPSAGLPPIVIPTGDPTAWPTPTITDQNPVGDPPDITIPTWGPADADAAAAAGGASLAAYAHPELPYQAWLTGLAPHVDPAVLDTYRDTNPADIPVHRVDLTTCAPVSNVDGWIATVQCGTDDGPWQVMVSRAAANTPWLAQWILPVEQN